MPDQPTPALTYSWPPDLEADAPTAATCAWCSDTKDLVPTEDERWPRCPTCGGN